MRVPCTGTNMYKNALFALLVAVFLLGSQATSAVEESNFAVGDKWAFGKEIDLMEEVSSQIAELENDLTELMSSEEAEMLKNATQTHPHQILRYM